MNLLITMIICFVISSPGNIEGCTNVNKTMNGYEDGFKQLFAKKVQQYRQKFRFEKNPDPYKFSKFENETGFNVLNYKGHGSSGRRLLTNPFLRAVNLALQRVPSIIASLKIPDIQPVLDIVTNGFSSMLTQITSLFENALGQVSKLIGDYTSGLTPEIERVVTEGNNSMRKSIVTEFDNARSNFTNDVIEITQNENQNSTDLVYSETSVLIERISKRLDTAEGLIDDAVNLGLSESVSDVLAAIRSANESVYTQITGLLADEENTDAILPQLVFADPKAIAGLISSDTGSLYTSVEAVLNEALADIGGYVEEASLNTVGEETVIVNAANDAIVTSLNKHVNTSLVAIRQNIDEITESEVAELSKLLDGGVTGLSTEIESIVDNLTPAITKIVNNESAIMVTSLNELVNSNNASVISQVAKLLATD